MNFSPFGSPFGTSIPSIHQFAAKFTQENGSAVAENSSRYTANGIPSFTHHHHATSSHLQTQPSSITNKYNNPSSNYLNAQTLYGTASGVVNLNKRQNVLDQHQELTQELCAALLQNQQEKTNVNFNKIKILDDDRINSNLHNQTQPLHQSSASTWQSLASNSSTMADYLSQLPGSTLPLSLHHFLKYSAETLKKESQNLQSNNETNLLLSTNGHTAGNIFNVSNVNAITNNGENLTNGEINNVNIGLGTLTTINTAHLTAGNQVESVRKKRKKKLEKEKKPKPKPGEIRLTTALDGSTLYCCPECHMAYPEKELLEQHLLGHTMERRFVCDICGAGLKRKDHLTRHKQSHNPERPYICSVCLKAFKRKEQLTLHFVIHSGEKRHVCQECGKGFYRKDHLRKHTRSHIARRVKAELTQQGTMLPSLSTVSASNMMT